MKCKRGGYQRNRYSTQVVKRLFFFCFPKENRIENRVFIFFSKEETQFLKSTVKMSSHYVPAVEESTGRNETDSKREEYIF